jgi:integral membrane protein (TIGR00529 family)
MGLGPLDLAASSIKSITSLQTISLILIVGLIMIMSRIMEKSGHMTRLVKSFTNLSRDARTVGPVMSALIGLLPMPGGALFSAPMVEASLSKGPASVEQKTAINYWFRHIWEYWWPLYPGVILAVALLEVETWRFMAFMAPMTIVSVLAGIFFILRPIGKTGIDHQGTISWSGIKHFLWEMIPILIVIFFIVALTATADILGLLGFGVNIPTLLSILPGLAISIVWVSYVNHAPLSDIGSAITSRDNLVMLFLVIAIMVFKGVMEDSNAVVHIRDEMIAYRIPVILLILIMPFLSGLVLGIAIGFVGASFPLIIPLFHTTDLLDYLSFAMLAYTFGYMGMMLSPVHLCLLVTKDYFKASLLSSYRQIIKPALAVMSVSLVLFLLTRILL